MEMIVVIAILAIMIAIASVRVFGRIKAWRLNEDVGRFTHTLNMAAEQAVFSGRTHAVVIGVYEGSYAIYPVNANNKYSDKLEPILPPQRLERCLIEKIDFENGNTQFSGEVVLYATPQGWSASILFNLRDKDYQRRYVRCDRLTTRVVYDNRTLELMKPRSSVSMYTIL